MTQAVKKYLAPANSRFTVITPSTTIVSTLTTASTVTMYVDTVYGKAIAATIETHQPASCTSRKRSIRGMRCALDRKLRAKRMPKTAADARPTGGDTVFHHVHAGQRNCAPRPVSAARPMPRENANAQ